jgi:hypothetical protein
MTDLRLQRPKTGAEAVEGSRKLNFLQAALGELGDDRLGSKAPHRDALREVVHHLLAGGPRPQFRTIQFCPKDLASALRQA